VTLSDDEIRSFVCKAPFELPFGSYDRAYAARRLIYIQRAKMRRENHPLYNELSKIRFRISDTTLIVEPSPSPVTQTALAEAIENSNAQA
jgi:hypothetical protein